MCENGLAQIGGIAVNELQVYTPDPDACQGNSEDFSGNVYGNGHIKLYEEIVDYFGRGIAYPVTREDTLATIRLLNSFYLAHESRRWVSVATAGDSARLGQPDEQLAGIYRTPYPEN